MAPPPCQNGGASGAGTADASATSAFSTGTDADQRVREGRRHAPRAGHRDARELLTLVRALNDDAGSAGANAHKQGFKVSMTEEIDRANEGAGDKASHA
jgi:hypothetical protein